jgi:23S rRNA pseudouridine1911/1915/1917 synthase
MEYRGHPLVGDPLYRRGLPGREGDPTHWRGFRRQALHACRLALEHPVRRRPAAWFRAPPADLAGLMTALGFDAIARPHDVFGEPA